MMNDYRAISDTATTSVPVEAPPKIKNVVQETIGMQKETMLTLAAIADFLFADKMNSLPDDEIKCLTSGMLIELGNMREIMEAAHNIATRLGVNG